MALYPQTNGPARHQLHAYAIVSADDRIADASGAFPDALRNQADWAYFQAGLDRAVLTLLGRRSHEAAPNAKGRSRLVMSRSVPDLVRVADAWWWNPAGIPLHEVLRTIVPDGGVVCVPGGQSAFDEIGPSGFTEFHLARAHPCRLPQG